MSGGRGGRRANGQRGAGKAIASVADDDPTPLLGDHKGSGSGHDVRNDDFEGLPNSVIQAAMSRRRIGGLDGRHTSLLTGKPQELIGPRRDSLLDGGASGGVRCGDAYGVEGAG